MHIHVPNKQIFEETSAAEAVKYFPYLRDRFDAIYELKRFYDDTARITMFGRLMGRKEGALRVRIGSVPFVILDHMRRAYGTEYVHKFLTTPSMIHDFLKANPEYSFIYGKR